MRAERPFFTTPFTREQGLGLGLTDWTIRTGYTRVIHGVYVSEGVRVTTELRAMAAMLVAPKDAALSDYTAAALWGGVAPEASDVCLVVPPGGRVRRDGLAVRESSRVDTAQLGPLVLTTPTQTFLDLGDDLDLLQLVVLGDSLVRAGRVTPDELVAAVGRRPGPKAKRLQRAVAYVRTGVDSPMETRLRMLLVLAGLPEPIVNHPVRDQLTGRVLYRLDLAYPDLHLAVEYDGRQHAENTAQWRWDVSRREELEKDGWRLLVMLSGDVYRTPRRTIARVLDAVTAKGGKVARASDEWRRYFPERD